MNIIEIYFIRILFFSPLKKKKIKNQLLKYTVLICAKKRAFKEAHQQLLVHAKPLLTTVAKKEKSFDMHVSSHT